MPTIKQETVNGHTVKLHKYRTEHPEHEYEYFVTRDGSPTDDPVYTRKDGDLMYQDTISGIEARSGVDSGFPGSTPLQVPPHRFRGSAHLTTNPTMTTMGSGSRSCNPVSGSF